MPGKPNILIIMSDQHSKHVLGCYGDPVVRTPHLDRLAAEGMRFTNTYCASPVCCPSRMSFMTGRTPARNRVWSNQQTLNPAIPTWAHTLGIAGYETSLLGRMHFEGHDQYHGFENRPIGEMFAVHPGGFKGEKYPSGQNRQVMELSGRGTTTYQWMDEKIADATCDYLKNRSGKPQHRPFAATVGFVLPHCPFIAPKHLFDYYHDRVDMPQIEADQPAMIRWYRKSRGIDTPLDDRRVRIARAAYYGLCEFTDALIGRILACLDETGLAENTLVVYCSDHGEMAGEHGCWTKNTYYEGSVGVPLIARLPGTIQPGLTCGAVCNLLDLGPTFADLAGAEALPDWDGNSLWPTLCGNHPADWPDETYSEVVDGSTRPNIPSRMIRSGKWKLWADQEVPGQVPNVALFDLENDPQELQDLSRHPRCAEIRRQLLEKVLHGWHPDAVRRAADQKRQDYTRIREWAQAVKPVLPETLPPPPPEIEDDVEIL